VLEREEGRGGPAGDLLLLEGEVEKEEEV